MNLRLGYGLFFLNFYLCSCGELPVLRLVSSQEQSIVSEDCLNVFPRNALQMVHAIEISLAGGGKSSLVGVCSLNPEDDEIRSLLISPEGLVIFDATTRHGQIQIARALEPLDRREFAAGLFADVRLVFFSPISDRVVAGRLEDGREGCRFQGKENITDLVFSESGGLSIVLYSSGGKLVREVILRPPFVRGVAQKMELRAPSMIGYQMKFELLQLEGS